MERRRFPPIRVLVAALLFAIALMMLAARMSPDAESSLNAPTLGTTASLVNAGRIFALVFGLMALGAALIPGAMTAHRVLARRLATSQHDPREGSHWAQATAAPVMDRRPFLRIVEPEAALAVADTEDTSTRLSVADEATESVGWLFRDAPAAHAGLTRELEFTRALASNLGDGVVAIDDAGRVTFVNPVATRMLGCSETQLIGRLLPPVLDLGETPVAGLVREVRLSGRTTRIPEAAVRREDGTELFVSVSVAPLTQCGRVSGAVLAVHDITERRAQVAALEHKALHDPLTDLPNRILFRDRLQQALLQAKRNATPVAVLVVDLDGFKAVNDKLGHQIGDVLLQQVGARTQVALRASDTVARLGGDEFAVILPGANGMGATRAAQQVLRALEHPFAIAEHTIHVGASIGIAFAPYHGMEPATLLRYADGAMYTAKSARSGIAMHSDGDESQIP